jgi:microsomal dipeptidase-like Zn-dependent dipeptidase
MLLSLLFGVVSCQQERRQSDPETQQISLAVTLSDVPLTGPVVIGAAALHEHVMAEHAFSGKWHWGSVEGTEAFAKGKCEGDGDTHGGALGVCFDPLYLVVPNALGRDTCCHAGGLFDCYEKRTDGNTGSLANSYKEWPIWDTKAHPQYWHGDLKNALAGGLKLMLFMAVENYAFCSFTANETWKGHPIRGNGYTCDHGDSYNSVVRQINNMKTFVQNHSDFLGIAYTPAQARTIISSGKMAIIIGIEADYAWGNERYPIDLQARLNSYHALGARHIYLAHSLNTRLAGAALYAKPLWAQQSMANCLFKNKQCTNPDPNVPSDSGHAYEIKQNWLCFGWPGYAKNYYDVCEWTMDRASDPDSWNGFKVGGTYTSSETLYDGTPVTVVKNSVGLTADGAMVVREMMKKGMLLEISHLSENAITAIYNISVANQSYPLMSSHTYSRKLRLPADAVEMALSDTDIDRIKTTEGIVGHFMGPDKSLTFTSAAYNGVANNCPLSSRSLAQYISYVRSKGVKVAWAGDLMGLAAGVAPRRGYTVSSTDWCEGNTTSQSAQGSAYNADLSTYATEDARGRAYYYTRGYGHHGLIKYLHEDLAAIGLAPTTLTEFKDKSAESFIRVWEKSEYISKNYTSR